MKCVQVNVALPLDGVPSDAKERMRTALLDDWNVGAIPFYYDNKWWVWCSTQIFNEVSDFEYLEKALKTICKDFRSEFSRK